MTQIKIRTSLYKISSKVKNKTLETLTTHRNSTQTATLIAAGGVLVAISAGSLSTNANTHVLILPSDSISPKADSLEQEETTTPHQSVSVKISTSFDNVFGDRFIEMETAISVGNNQSIPEPMLLLGSLAAGGLGLALRNPSNQKEGINIEK